MLGVGALANSLWAHGFRGEFVAGYRGELTHWAASARSEGPDRVFDAGEGRRVRFVRLDTDWHLTNRKPYFLRDVWPCGSPSPVFYFDPDIVVTVRWSFYTNWVRYGLPLVIDPALVPMPHDHPCRHGWVEWLQDRGYCIIRRPDFYYNGGFVGFSPDRRSDIYTWCDLHDGMSEVIPMDRIGPVTRTELFNMSDQDALNMLAMISGWPISTMGPEAMELAPGGCIMSHSAGGVKSWRKRYIASAFGGVPPTMSDRRWLHFTRDPIEVISGSAHRRLHWQLRCAAAIGRLIRRAY